MGQAVCTRSQAKMHWFRHNFIHSIICLVLYIYCCSCLFRWRKRTLEVLFIGQSKFNDFFSYCCCFVAVKFLFKFFPASVKCCTLYNLVSSVAWVPDGEVEGPGSISRLTNT